MSTSDCVFVIGLMGLYATDVAAPACAVPCSFRFHSRHLFLKQWPQFAAASVCFTDNYKSPVCRVDALEAELISTKEGLYESLMRQEELLAYIDRYEDAMSWRKRLSALKEDDEEGRY
ncbi:hypothetical protein HPP92_000153 [Vanilla planifolia]|uniref:Uncharacterized protein n=1 Tax=Vanilla planifolia TaxID=51239 RepID=A0A835S0Q9_VANPL|nr:hypothetical protein HPP92_000153 [Vanilla planifolia]